MKTESKQTSPKSFLKGKKDSEELQASQPVMV